MLTRRIRERLLCGNGLTSQWGSKVGWRSRGPVRLYSNDLSKNLKNAANERSERRVDDIVQDIGHLPSESEKRRSNLVKWFSDKMDNFQATLFTAGQALNDATGYSAIERLKRAIDVEEQHMHSYRHQVSRCKAQYEEAVTKRSETQKEINELLQRKSQWAPSDLERFTQLYRDNHGNESAVETAKQQLNEAELALEESRSAAAKLIGARYREEQIWSDKIRRASTWGTWGLMGFNVVLFIVVQLGLEPWKRKRLVGSFEDKVKVALEDAAVTQHERIDRLEGKLQELMSVETKAPEPLRLSNLKERLIDSTEPIQIRPIELFSTAGISIAIGVCLGLLTFFISR